MKSIYDTNKHLVYLLQYHYVENQGNNK